MRTQTPMNPLEPAQVALAMAAFLVLLMLSTGALVGHEEEPPLLVRLAFGLLAGHALLLAALRLVARSSSRSAIECGATISLCFLLAVPIVWNLVVEWPGLVVEERILHSILSLLFLLPPAFLVDAAWSAFRRSRESCPHPV